MPRRQKRDPLHVVVDSTGVKVYGEGEWKVRQHGYGKRRTWRKLHLGADAATGEIVAAVVSTTTFTDGQIVLDLVEQVEGDIEQVSGDGGYDKRSCYDAIAARGARAAIPPPKNAKIWQHGNSKEERLARDENVRACRQKGRAAWKRESGYHRRSLAETQMFRLKTIFGERVSARSFAGQATQLLVRCAVLNTRASKTPLKALREVADDYEREHPGVKIKFVGEQFQQYNSVVRVKAAAGELWDVYWVQWTALNNALLTDIAVDLSPYFNEKS